MKLDPDTYSKRETARRAEAALKKMLSTPHKPHAKARKKIRKPRKAR